MHYAIASQILKARDYDKNDFALGNILPDALNGEAKHTSHFRKKANGEYILWGVDFEKFKQKYINDFNDALVLGYYCHLLSDYIWFNNTFSETKEMDPQSKESALFADKVYSDMHILNKLLVDYYKLSVPDYLKKPDNIIIHEISGGDVNALINDLINDFNDAASGTPEILTMDVATGFIGRAVDFCLSEI